MDKKVELLHFWNQHFKFKQHEIEAFNSVDRALFVLDNYRHLAYEDNPLPLFRGKTISQPTTVMIMTSALELAEDHTVFEVGTGSGYQAAIMAKIVGTKGKVVSTEIIPELVNFAKNNFVTAGISNITVYEDDGSLGMEKEAPFDRIMLTAACKEFPKPLVEQLKVGGVIVGPVGDKAQQEMVRGTKRADGKLDLEFLGPFLFTPMYGKHGFEEE